MLCNIEADLSRAPILTLPKVTGKGDYYSVDCDIILLFGMTELQAQLAWMENVSRLRMLPTGNQTDIGLILYMVFREERNGKFFKRNCFLVELP